MPGQMNSTVQRASLGQLAFVDDIDAPTREAIRDMWINRLVGFRYLDRDRYLSHQTDETRYVTAHLKLRGKAFRRVSGVLFIFRRLVRWVGLDIDADVLDACVTCNGELFITRGRLVLMIRGRVVRAAQLTFSIRPTPAGLVWHEARVSPVSQPAIRSTPRRPSSGS